MHVNILIYRIIQSRQKFQRTFANSVIIKVTNLFKLGKIE